MEKLPTEIILQILIDTEHQELLKLIKTNRRLNTIYKDNKEYIYRKKLHKEFPCIETSEDLYFQLYNSWNQYERVCGLIQTYTQPECKDILEYSKMVLKNVNREFTSREEKLDLLIQLYTNLYRCSDNLEDAKLKKGLAKKLEEVNSQVNSSIAREYVYRWRQFYKDIGEKIIKNFK